MIHWTVVLLIAFICLGAGFVLAFWVMMKALAEAVEEFFEKLN